MKKNKNESIKYIIGIILIVIAVICYNIYRRGQLNYKFIRQDKAKDLVYTQSNKRFGNYSQTMPFLNIKGETAEAINKDITEIFQFYAKKNIRINYEYDLNGKILSLVIVVEDHSYLESTIMLNFRTYNINLDSLSLLTKEQIFNYFSLTSDSFENKLLEKIAEKYQQQVKKGIVNGDKCDFDCYCKSRNIDEGINDVELYIKDGKLVALKPYAFMNSTTEKKEYGFLIE